MDERCGGEVRWLDGAERRTWMTLLATTARLDGALDRQMQRDAGMPLAYYQILAMLSEAPRHTLRMTDLAEITQSSQSRISHAVKRLEMQSWVLRRPCADDRRSTLAELTDAGHAALVAAAPAHVAAVRAHLFDALSTEQVGQLREILGAVLSELPET
ncbi:MarR family transcriptional regulator [Pseudonocardia sp. KRD291]|uniref:MarR family winged helix-turn-helix transcriptional regulator n=1 Tax=Pseudonocardia sp. KRD291 TaxID=2792007 RepID=UPI0027E264D8|nr:MarR family transcriptional regulator [Pseudonocardia sp. KRD291]